MTQRIRTALAIGLVVATSALGAQQPAPQRAPGTLNEGVTAVLVDVVVRDRRGQPVRDLTPADFQILEDGVAQPIGSFTPFTDPRSAAPAAAAPAPAAREGTAAPAVDDRCVGDAV